MQSHAGSPWTRTRRGYFVGMMRHGKGSRNGTKVPSRRCQAFDLSQARGRGPVLRLADGGAGDAGARVACRLRFVVVRIAVDDQPLADDVGISAADGNAGNLEGATRIAVRVRLEVRHVAGMVVSHLRAVRLARRVVVAAGAHAVAGGAIAFLVNVEGM